MLRNVNMLDIENYAFTDVCIVLFVGHLLHSRDVSVLKVKLICFGGSTCKIVKLLQKSAIKTISLSMILNDP